MLERHHYRTLALSLLIVLLGLLTYLAPSNWEVEKMDKASEITQIVALKTPSAQSAELLKLLKRVGPVETQEQMLHSGLPFTGETHLLIHTVGDYIYNQYGLDGLQYCRDYFLSACYHGFIIDALADHGLDGVAEAMESCRKAGTAVSAQCAHASGHGFLAWHDYEPLKALAMCDELGGKVPNFAYFNCYDGVFMENIWGVHNGAPSEKRWIKESDIYYPCDDPRIPEKYLKGCWSNQATLMYQHFKGDLQKTAQACDSVPNPVYKETCYNNFSRQIHPLTQGSVEKVKSLCTNATGQEWQDYCILTNMTSYWSVGDHVLPGKICASLNDPLKTTCFTRLESLINYQQ
jgi:hypothetical protein